MVRCSWALDPATLGMNGKKGPDILHPAASQGPSPGKTSSVSSQSLQCNIPRHCFREYSFKNRHLGFGECSGTQIGKLRRRSSYLRVI